MVKFFGKCQDFRKVFCHIFCWSLTLHLIFNFIDMETKENYSNMPKTIIIESERQMIDEALRKALREAHDAYNALKEMEDLKGVPEAHNCTTEWLNQITTAKKQAVNNADFLTIEQKKSQIAHWGKFAKKVLGYIEVLQNFISSIPSDQYVFDKELGTFYIKDLPRLVESRCLHEVPENAGKHFQLIRNVREAIDELRKWERDEDLKKLRLEDLFSFTDRQIAEAWVTNNIQVDHTFDHLPGIVEKRAMSQNDYL